MRILGRYEGPHAFGFAGDRFGVWDFGAKVRSAAGFRGTMQASSLTNVFKAIPHNSKCRYGERGAADAKPKAQIIICVLSSILATQMPCRSCRSGA